MHLLHSIRILKGTFEIVGFILVEWHEIRSMKIPFERKRMIEESAYDRT